MQRSLAFAAGQAMPYTLDALLERVHAKMLELLEPVCREHGLTFDQYMVLTSLHDGLALTPTDLAQQYRRNRTSVTRIIDRLERLVLVQRLRGATDRRKVRLRLTASGQAAIDTLVPKMLATLSLALLDISSEDIETLDRLLLTVLTTMASVYGSTVQEGGKALGPHWYSTAT